jgi:hypothetical protein
VLVEDDTMDQRALPAPDQPDEPDHPRGRHEAPRRGLGGPAAAAIAVVLGAVVFAGVLATWLISSADEAPEAVGAEAATTAAGGPTSRPPGQGSFGNLVSNWSFEQDLAGWEVLGAADASREPQGRTSGSCASVRAREPGQVRLALPEAIPEAKKGQRYVASAWVRSTAPGLRVTIRLSGAGGAGDSSKATATTLPGLEWRRVIVPHIVASPGPLRLEVVADGVPAGDALLADEVVVRQG